VNATSGVGLTAIAAAAARAVESSRPDRLIDDPLAAAFVAAANPPMPLPRTVAGPRRRPVGPGNPAPARLRLHGVARPLRR
jgi:hypothetical protein